MPLSELVTFARSHATRDWDVDGNADGPAEPTADDMVDWPIDYEPADRRPAPDWTRDGGDEAFSIWPLGVEPDDSSGSATGVVADELAFYLPFHFHSPERWGIYIRESGVAQLARAFRLEPSVRWETAVTRAWEVLLCHERFHCMAEAAATRGETFALIELYEPYFNNRRATPHEEALANAFALRQLLRVDPLAVDSVESWMSTQPPGYRDYWLYLDRDSYNWGLELASTAMAGSPGRGSIPSASASRSFVFRRVGPLEVPVRLVRDLVTPILSVIRRFPAMGGVQIDVHTHDHPPPHIHVRIPPRSKDFKLTWPDLGPVGPKGRRLTRKEEAALDRYLGTYGEQIAAKVASITWTP